MKNATHNEQELQDQINKLKLEIYGRVDTLDTINARSQGVALLATEQIMKADFNQSDLDILSRKIKQVEEDIKKIKEYINRYL